jgi:hypothetical protein
MSQGSDPSRSRRANSNRSNSDRSNSDRSRSTGPNGRQPASAGAQGEAVDRRHWLLGQWPITIVLVGITVALLMIALDHFRRGSIVLSASVMLAAFLRLLLPDAEAGMLAVRSRKVDVAVLGGLAIGLSIFTYWVPPPN